MEQVLWIPGPMPALNELLAARSKRRGQWSAYSTLKRTWQARIIQACKDQGITPIDCAYFEYEWREKHKRRDPDGISSGGRKIILDALVQGGFLPNDGWRNVAGWSDRFLVDTRNPGVQVSIIG